MTDGSDHEIELALKAGASDPGNTWHGVVTGTVTKADGSAAVSAKVTFTQDGSEKSHAATDTSGGYRTESLLPGRYWVKAELPAHTPSDKIDLDVKPGEVHKLDLMLKS